MKKFFNHATILIVATLFTFNACLLTDPYIPYVPIENGETTSVLLSFSQDAELETRDGSPYQYPVRRLLTGDLYLVAPSGIIIEHFRIVNDGSGTTPVNGEIPATAHTINLSDLISDWGAGGDGVRITGVPASMRYGRMYLIGNPRVNNPTTGHISAVLNQPIIDMRHQRSRGTGGPHLFGYTPLERISADGVTPEVWAPPIFLCCDTHLHWCPRCGAYPLPPVPRERRILRVSPITAFVRIVSGIVGMGQIGPFTVEGVFIDNYYRLATVDGRPVDGTTLVGTTPVPTSLRRNIVEGRQFDFNSSGYPAAFRNYTFFWHNNGTSPYGRRSHLAHHTIPQYNIFGELFYTAWANPLHSPLRFWTFYVLAGKETAVPHIVFRLRDVTVAGVERPGPYYVTFHNFVSSSTGDPVQGISAGFHHAISPVLIFTEHDLSPVPSLATTLSTRAVPIMIEE